MRKYTCSCGVKLITKQDFKSGRCSLCRFKPFKLLPPMTDEEKREQKELMNVSLHINKY